mmetsp:Transcript_5521/g.12251  ORF Transcript_5521/g.12251 Transcript_5521/m.12251 type:complete len:206 (-) Transcript_5521:724-1341(-)
MNHRHRLTGTSQDKRIFHSSIASTNNNNMLPSIHVSIARSTTAHTTSSHLVLSLDVEPVTLCSSCYNHRMSLNHTGVGYDFQRTTAGINTNDSFCFKRSTKLNSLLSHQCYHRRTSNVEQSRVVLHIDSLPLQLSSHGWSHNHRLQSSTSSVNRSRQTCRTTANDGNSLRKRGGSPRMFKLSFVVVFFFDLGFTLCVETLLNFCH